MLPADLQRPASDVTLIFKEARQASLMTTAFPLIKITGFKGVITWSFAAYHNLIMITLQVYTQCIRESRSQSRSSISIPEYLANNR